MTDDELIPWYERPGFDLAAGDLRIRHGITDSDIYVHMNPRFIPERFFIDAVDELRSFLETGGMTEKELVLRIYLILARGLFSRDLK